MPYVGCNQEKVNQIYCSQLECFVQYKTLLDYSLTDEKTHCPPWCLTLTTTGKLVTLSGVVLQKLNSSAYLMAIIVFNFENNFIPKFHIYLSSVSPDKVKWVQLLDSA